MPLIRKDRFKIGDHNVISDYSGQKFKRSDCELTWDNKLVSKSEFEPKHPQLTIRPRADRPAITDQTRTQQADAALIAATYDPSGGV